MDLQDLDFSEGTPVVLVMPDGRLCVGTTATQIVEQMSEAKMSTPRSLRSYRKAVARRAKQYNIDPTDDESFLRTLLDAKLIVRSA